jgi:hypothetical protein
LLVWGNGDVKKDLKNYLRNKTNYHKNYKKYVKNRSEKDSVGHYHRVMPWTHMTLVIKNIVIKKRSNRLNNRNQDTPIKK